MFVIYRYCRATEDEPAGWLIATDTEIEAIEYEAHELSECIWLVPNIED
jgi:hypothetical protein